MGIDPYEATHARWPEMNSDNLASGRYDPSSNKTSCFIRETFYDKNGDISFIEHLEFRRRINRITKILEGQFTGVDVHLTNRAFEVHNHDQV